MQSYWCSKQSKINIIYNISVITIIITMSIILANFGKYAISDCPFICLLMAHDSRCKTWFRHQYLMKYILHEISWRNAFIHCRDTESTHRSHTVLSFRRFLCWWLLIHETLLACTNSSQLSRVPWHGLVWQVVARHSIFSLRFYCDT